MNTGVFIAVVVGAAALIWIVVFMRRRSKWTRRQAQSNLGGLGTLADKVHLPSDDPLWQAHSKQMVKRRPKRRKAWAAGSAGALGAGYVDSHGSCEGGGGGCGGGGCGGGS